VYCVKKKIKTFLGKFALSILYLSLGAIAYMTFGERVKKLRNHLGYTQEDFAQKLELKKSYISNVENGDRTLSTQSIQTIVSEFNVDARWFFGQLDSVEDAVLADGEAPTTENLMHRLNALESKVRGPQEDDPLAEKVRINQPLRELVEMVQFWDGNMIRRFRDIAYGFLTGKEYGDDQKGVDSGRKHA
jgi:transcriptional regulator with XRE-family HTH domain